MAAGFFGKSKRTGGLLAGTLAAIGLPAIARGVSGLANWAASKLRG